MANTQGLIVPETSPNFSGANNSAPTPKPETPKEEGWWKRWGSDVTHGVLDVVGLVPVLGEVANGAGALIYLAEGDPVSAAFDAAAMWPAGGQAATGGKYAAKAATKAAKEAAQAAEKKLAKEAAEAAEKKALKEAEEKAAKKKAEEGGNVKRDCKALEGGIPGAKYKGGKYSSVKKGGAERGQEAHHMPADAASPKGTSEGVAIQMDKGDHAQTASYDNKAGSAAYRATQKQLAASGKAGYAAAMAMDVADIRSKFGDKYDGAIAQGLLYAKCMGFI
jgi:hypothetical protein